MRVLHLIPTLGKGGAERQVSLLGPALAAEGQEIAIAFHTGGPNLCALQTSNIPLFKLPSRANHDPRLLTDIASVLERFPAEILQTWLPQMDVLGGLVAHWKGVKHVLCERSSEAAYAKPGLKLTTRIALGKRAAAIVANSNAGLEYWRKSGAKIELRLIRNALTPFSTTKPSDDLGLDGRRLIVAAGRLSYEKNITVLINALAGALKMLPDHHAVIFGEGPERASAETLISVTGVANRLHLGGYTESLYWWLVRADCFVSTSLMEGHPNAVIEAAAAGCSLVLSDIPAHREFLPKDSALFSPTHDAAAFTKIVIDSIQNIEASTARSYNAKLLTEELAVKKIAHQYMDLYGDVVGPAKLISAQAS